MCIRDSSGTVLSQFDGPVKFNKDVKINDAATIDGILKVTDTTQSTDVNSGALQVDGGAGIEKNLYVGGNASVAGNLTVSGDLTIDSSSTLVSSAGSFGNIQIAVTDDNTIDTQSGNLNINAAGSGTLVAIQTNTTITGILSVTDDITAFWSSDERLKDNITKIDNPLDKVLSISGNTFDWNEKSNKSGHDVGLIAQEIEKVLPEAVTTRDNGYLAVDYHKVCLLYTSPSPRD